MSSLSEAKAIKDYLIEQRNYFHSHPELGLKEFITADRIEEELKKTGLKPFRVGQTGVAAEIDSGKPGKTLFMRADIDALPIQEKNDVPYKSTVPGVMHACGHDGHTASLLGAAKLLVNHKDDFKGKIILAFQPAEEIGKGASDFLKAGILDSVDRIYGIHFASSIPVGSYAIKAGECMASCDYFKITIHGKSAHISRPCDGADALFVGAMIVSQLQTIVTRLIPAAESGVVGVGSFHSGNTYNIISNHAEIEGTTRAFSAESRRKINDAIRAISTHIAEEYGAKADVLIEAIADPCLNNAESAEEQYKSALKIVDKTHIITNEEKRFWADNFADYMRKAPGCYSFVGSADGNSTSWDHHNEHFDLAEDSLVYAAALHLQYALDYLNGSF